MRPIFLTLVLSILSLPVYGQAGFGVEAGMGSSSMKFAPPLLPIAYTSGTTGAIASGKIGAFLDLPLNKHTYFQGGVYLSRRGAVRDFSYYKSDSTDVIHQELDIYYFDLPLNIVYKSGHQGKSRFIAGIGATISDLAGGKNNLREHQVFNDTTYNINTDGTISPGNTIHAFDIGINLLAGYELPTGLFFRAYYTAGVQDIGIGTEIDKNRMWGIAAGFIFGNGRDINKDKEADDLIDKTGD